MAERNNGGIIQYEGSDPSNPHICRAVLIKDIPSGIQARDGQERSAFFGLWGTQNRSSAVAYPALQQLMTGPPGTTASFTDTAAYGVWQRDYRKESGEILEIGGRKYPTIKVTQRVRGQVGNGFEAVYTTWFDATRLMALKSASQHISGEADRNPASVNWEVTRISERP